MEELRFTSDRKIEVINEDKGYVKHAQVNSGLVENLNRLCSGIAKKVVSSFKECNMLIIVEDDRYLDFYSIEVHRDASWKGFILKEKSMWGSVFDELSKVGIGVNALYINYEHGRIGNISIVNYKD